MNGHRQQMNLRPLGQSMEHVVPHVPWWRRLHRRHRGPWELERQGDDQRLARCVQDIIVELGLTQTTYSISGGHTRHVPEVISVTGGPPHRVDVRILRSQAPEDFAAYAPAIARKLGVAEVRVLPLGNSVIRLELLLEQS